VTEIAEAAEAKRAERDRGFHYIGWTGGILPLTLKNALLNILTLAIYRFWAKTDVRRHLWRHTHFLGDPLEYTGIGKELFLGFLLVLFVVFVPLAIANELLLRYLGPFGATQILSIILVLFLIGVAQYRARRYRLSRTTWRGIRAAQTGEAWLYGLKRLGFWILLVPTLGWSYPWQRVHLTQYEMNNTVFGDRKFSFDGSPRPLYKPFAIAWVISFLIVAVVYLMIIPDFKADLAQDVVTLEDTGGLSVGIFRALTIGTTTLLLFLLAAPFIVIWYRVREFAYLISCAEYEGIKFNFDVGYWHLFRLAVGNYLITFFTLGFGLPIVQTRKFQFFCTHIKVHGSADFDAIHQSTEDRDKLGEGLADAFDIGDF